jgi:hypothetical protein
MAELSTRLDHLHLLTDAPQRLVAFHGETLGMTPRRSLTGSSRGHGSVPSVA